MTLALDSPKLRELTRTQLQSLAKVCTFVPREVVRAIGKTENIIRRLIQKHPRGVPVPVDADNPGSASSAPLKRHVLEGSYKGTPSLSPVPGTCRDPTDPKGKGKQAAEAASPSPSSSTEALELLYPDDYDEPAAGPSNATPESASTSHPVVAQSTVPSDHPPFPSGELFSVAPPEHLPHAAQCEDNDNDTHNRASPSNAPNPGWQADEEDEYDSLFGGVDYPKGAPTHYMVVDALRQFTTLVNTIPSTETRIAEGRCLLKRTEILLEKAMPDARELVVTREYLETFLLGKMKEKRELWDGTAKMGKKDRKLRMEWLRAERKAKNERKWKETNELYKKKGLKPEPFSAFASQSDEEVIESLETTPTSSRSGSSKRSREESVDGNADGNAEADGESQRKRARS
ncbi:hypothetical protein JVT61DRAFT_562 [Boletus reticuloceps]|uniref:Uncharacterized protein n=1 Tax=Boletus reticuloceps TaxID=495285 RepID=A0A8I3AE12_9AGAM|nr:hypothetical protein JVT61DRAFT_562 [Boletus reticuloceps]